MDLFSVSDRALNKVKFDKAYTRLNPRQREAVESIEGPVMVIAGPGTGKTQILSVRIGNILRKTDTDPRSILCLTYTDSGAMNMRQRLLEFIGSDAYSVGIFTFTAFAIKSSKIIPMSLESEMVRRKSQTWNMLNCSKKFSMNCHRKIYSIIRSNSIKIIYTD
ncbi:MAG: UvrD-helicase domain-containing protein [Saprospiraceae bacterium]|nr:UvrD-helicase domain-containing protein [Saprospiraceae bacterium]